MTSSAAQVTVTLHREHAEKLQEVLEDQVVDISDTDRHVLIDALEEACA